MKKEKIKKIPPCSIQTQFPQLLSKASIHYAVGGIDGLYAKLAQL